MNYMEAIESLEEMVRTAKSVPLSASAVIPREEALGLVQTIRASLPAEHERAKEILAERDDVLARARAEADEILNRARAEQARLVDETEVVNAAKAEAERVTDEAEKAANKLKHRADDYVDAKLANFEILLNKVLRTVHRGREQLRTRLEAAEGEPPPPLTFEDSGEISGPIAAPPPVPGRGVEGAPPPRDPDEGR